MTGFTRGRTPLLLSALLLVLSGALWIQGNHWSRAIDEVPNRDEGRQQHSKLVDVIDFARSLGASSDAGSLVQSLRESAEVSGASIESVGASEAPASEERLGRLMLVIDLKGSYPQIKAALAATVDKNPTVVLQGLAIKRKSLPTDLSAHVELFAASRPVDGPVGAASASLRAE